MLYFSKFDFKLYHYSGRLIDKSNTLSQRLNHGTGSHDNKDIVLIKLEFLTIQVLEGIVVEYKGMEILRISVSYTEWRF